VTDLKYQEESSAAYGEQAARTWTYSYVPDDNPDHIDFAGVCPKCKHDSSYRWPLSIVRESLRLENSLDDQDAAVPEPVVVRCQCATSHPGNGGEKGCGRYWILTVPGR